MFEEGTILNELLVERLNYFIYVVLLLIGLHAMISKRNLIKKLIGMSIFQTAIILFYVSISVKQDATIPIYKAEHDPHGEHLQNTIKTDQNDTGEKIAPHGPVALKADETAQYANPLPHVLMLTAIVVGVATLGLALALCQRIYQGYGTIEEDELLNKIEQADARASLSPLEKKSSSTRKSSRRSRTPVAKKSSNTQPSRVKGDSPKKSPQSKRKSSTPAKKSGQGKKVAGKSLGKKSGNSSRSKKGSA